MSKNSLKCISPCLHSFSTKLGWIFIQMEENCRRIFNEDVISLYCKKFVKRPHDRWKSFEEKMMPISEDGCLVDKKTCFGLLLQRPTQSDKIAILLRVWLMGCFAILQPSFLRLLTKQISIVHYVNAKVPFRRDWFICKDHSLNVATSLSILSPLLRV